MRRMVLLLAGFIAALILAGCAGGDDEASTTAASETTTESSTPPPAAKGHWVITDLGTLGGLYSAPYDINERGQVVGDSWPLVPSKASVNSLGGGGRAFLWQNGKMIDLGTLPGSTDSIAVAINDRGQAVGYSYVPTYKEEEPVTQRATLWQGGRTIHLGTLGGTYSEAIAINDRGQVVGTSETATGDWKLFLWQNGKMRTLGIDNRYETALAINKRGEVMGTYETDEGNIDRLFVHAFVWANGKLNDLGTLGGPDSEAAAINDDGQIVGSSDTEAKDKFGDPVKHAFLWTEGTMRDLGTLGGPSSEALAINNRGQVLGKSLTETGAVHTFLWEDGEMTDLGAFSAFAINERVQVVGQSMVWEEGAVTDLRTLPGGHESEAIAINNRGQILGWSETKSGVNHAVLWTLKRG